MKKKRKTKKHGAEDLLNYMQLLEDGMSASSIVKLYGGDRKHLTVLWERYKEEGAAALCEKRHVRLSAEKKKEIVLDIENNHLTLCAASVKYGPCVDSIRRWHSIARREGLDALEKRGCPKRMARPKKNSKPLTELERLQKENQELKTQIALLKKVRALVEERNARLREIGRGPLKS